jgi:hypothetical protein
VTASFLNISISLQTVFAADAHLAGQVLCEKPAVNRGKSQNDLIGTRMPTVSSKEGQHLKQ